MKFTKDEIRASMLLYAVTDEMWLKEGQTLASVTEEVLKNGATFLQIREKELGERFRRQQTDREVKLRSEMRSV